MYTKDDLYLWRYLLALQVADDLFQTKDQVDWPDKFSIDQGALPTSLRNALHQKKTLRKSHLILVMNHLYETITRYTL